MRTLREGDPRLKEYVVYISLAANSLLKDLPAMFEELLKLLIRSVSECELSLGQFENAN